VCLYPLRLRGRNVEHVDREANDPASNLPVGSYLLAPFEELQETDKLPVNASVLTRLVQALASLGAASVSWVLMTNARGRGAMCCSVVDDRGWLAVAPENRPSLESSGSKRLAAPSPCGAELR
jgi:hypothetical protein